MRAEKTNTSTRDSQELTNTRGLAQVYGWAGPEFGTSDGITEKQDPISADGQSWPFPTRW